MKQLILIAVILLQVSLAFAQKEKRDIHKGNQLYEQQKYQEAEAFYKKSVAQSKESVIGNFNLADAWYKQKKYEDAVQKFTDIATSTDDKNIKAKAYHNLGNTLLESKKLEESIEAYKKSLMNNPKDDETRYNLAYAQEKLKQQQQQQQNKDKKDKDSKDNKGQNNKDQQNKKDEDKDQQKKDKQDQKDKDQDGKDDQNQDNKDDQKGEKPRPDQLSKEDAERMLNALKNEEKNTQEKMKNKKGTAVKGRIIKEW